MLKKAISLALFALAIYGGVEAFKDGKAWYEKKKQAPKTTT